MLQRVQTVWLLLAGVAAFFTIKLPFYSGLKIQSDAAASPAYTRLTAMEPFYLLAVTIIIGLIAFVTIGLYKNRVLQLRLCVAGIVLEAILIFLYYQVVKSTYVAGQGDYALTALIHSLIVLFFFLAARAINKDEKLVKQSDRLR